MSDAVGRSGLPSHARNILRTLLERADVDTCEVPHWRCPSYTELAELTGMARRTVVTYVKQLSELGWLIRTAPSKIGALIRRERNRYQIRVPGWAPPPAAEGKPAGRALGQALHSSLDLKNKDQNLDARARAKIPADTVIGKVRRRIFPEKRKPTPPALAHLSPADQRTITEHVQRLAKAPIGNMGAYLATMDRNGQLAPIIASVTAGARERQQRAVNPPQYLADLEQRRNATTTASDGARAAIRALISAGKRG